MLLLLSSILILSACVAVPDVSWLPAVLTPGKSISALPLNDTPPIFLADCNVVAVSALPVRFPVTLPVTLPVRLPVRLAAAKEVGPVIAVQCTVPHFCADDPKL